MVSANYVEHSSALSRNRLYYLGMPQETRPYHSAGTGNRKRGALYFYYFKTIKSNVALVLTLLFYVKIIMLIKLLSFGVACNTKSAKVIVRTLKRKLTFKVEIQIP